jgi:hypothetical protein
VLEHTQDGQVEVPLRFVLFENQQERQYVADGTDRVFDGGDRVYAFVGVAGTGREFGLITDQTS